MREHVVIVDWTSFSGGWRCRYKSYILLKSGNKHVMTTAIGTCYLTIIIKRNKQTQLRQLNLKRGTPQTLHLKVCKKSVKKITILTEQKLNYCHGFSLTFSIINPFFFHFVTDANTDNRHLFCAQQLLLTRFQNSRRAVSSPLPSCLCFLSTRTDYHDCMTSYLTHTQTHPLNRISQLKCTEALSYIWL